MKPNGCQFEYKEERNRDLMRAYHEVIDESAYISLPDIYRRVVKKPSKRFWVSEERAAIVIASMMKGDTLKNMKANKRAMFKEIYRRVLKIRKLNPDMPVSQMAFIATRQPAPQFYLTPGSARIIIYNAKRKWYEEKRRKLRHLF